MARKKEWTDKEIEYLKENYTRKSSLELKTKLNRSINAIRKYAYNMGIKRQTNFTWQADEDYFLKDNQDLDLETLADKLERSKSSVNRRLIKLGLKVKQENDLKSVKNTNRAKAQKLELGKEYEFVEHNPWATKDNIWKIKGKVIAEYKNYYLIDKGTGKKETISKFGMDTWEVVRKVG